MASTLVKIDIHLIFHVKSTGMIIHHDDLVELFAYIGGIINNLGGIPITIGGMPDHIHILTSLPKNMALTDFVRTIKANSSKWLNLQEKYHSSFQWQNGYGAFSVSPTLLDKTIQYIKSQEQHHLKRTFKEEYELFLEAYNVEYDPQYAFCD